MFINTILQGNNIETLKTIPDNSVDCCVTSPPYYGCRIYTPDLVKLKADAPKNIINELEKRGIKPVDIKEELNKSDIPEELLQYFEPAEIGLEETPYAYIQRLVDVFREVKRILKDNGTLWLNIGDSYAGSGRGAKDTKRNSTMQPDASYIDAIPSYKDDILKPKDLMLIPFRLAIELQADGWYVRQDIIWSKPSPMPSSVKDRFCGAHEYIFLLSKSPKYYFDYKHALEPAEGYDGRKDTVMKQSNKYAEQQPFAAREHERWRADENGNPVRLKRDVWTVASESSEIEHFAMYPQKLILPCILCGCPENGIVLDPFMGSGTTGVVAVKNMRNYIGCELNPEYVKIAEQRIANERGLF